MLDLGANACNVARALLNPPSQDLSSSMDLQTSLSHRISELTCAESSPSLLHRDSSLSFTNELNIKHVVLPRTEHLPFPPQSFDAVLSSLSLHWINDLPSYLSQIAAILRPDRPFIAAMLGGDSLYELRTSLQLASLDRRGGLSTHTSPLADVRDVGGLLQRAGFKMLTVDVDDIVIEYPSTFAIMKDLQAMGESNAVMGREMGPIRREVLAAAEGIYRELHADGGEKLPATFRIIYMIGWTEGEGQLEPLKRGSGQVSMKDILEGGGRTDGNT